MTRSVDEIVRDTVFSKLNWRDDGELWFALVQAGIAEGRRQGIEAAAKQDDESANYWLRSQWSIARKAFETSAARHRSLIAPPQETAHDRR